MMQRLLFFIGYLHLNSWIVLLVFGIGGWVGVKCMDGPRFVQAIGWICLIASLGIVLLYLLGFLFRPMPWAY